MYAVIKTGGKQYKVSIGQKLKVEKLQLEPNSTIKFDQVLMLLDEDNSLKLGTPCLKDMSVEATVVSHGKQDKIKIFKLRRRKHYQKHQGHRQNFTEIYINKISENL